MLDGICARGARRPEHRHHRALRTGKSVTLKHIVGLLEPDAGRVLVDGAIVQRLDDRDALAALRGRIGYVFQFAALFDSMTVGREHPPRPGRRGLDEAEIRERVTESLGVVDLPGREASYPAELTGGMRKRVGIARAIALRPRYILYDEPTTGLDPVTPAVMDQLMIAHARSRRHRARGHPRHAQRLHGGRPDRDAARGNASGRRHRREDPGDRRSGGAAVHRGTADPGSRPAWRRMKRSNEFAVGLVGARGPGAGDRRRALAERDRRRTRRRRPTPPASARRRLGVGGAGHAARRAGRTGGGDPPGRERMGGDRVQHRPRGRAAAQAGRDLLSGQSVRRVEAEHRSHRAAAGSIPTLRAR